MQAENLSASPIPASPITLKHTSITTNIVTYHFENFKFPQRLISLLYKFIV